MDFEDLIEKVDLFLTESKLSGRLEKLDRLFEDRVRVGLDIGVHAVKMAQVRDTAAGPELLAWGLREIPAAGTNRDDEIVGAVRDLFQEKKIRPQRIRAVISDPNLYLRHISIPVVPEDDLVKAVKWQAEKYVPFSIDEARVDFQILRSRMRGGEKQMDILIVAAENSLIERYVNLLREARLMPTTLDVAPFAAARALIHNYHFEDNEIVPLVDIGDQMTSIVVVKKDQMQMVRSVTFGTRSLTDRFAKEMGVAPGKAGELVKDISLPAESQPGPDTDMKSPNAWDAFRTELVNQLNRSLAYCEQEFIEEKIQRVYLCGGGARIRDIDSCLAADLSLPVEIADPVRQVRTTLDESSAARLVQAGPQLMAVIGEIL